MKKNQITIEINGKLEKITPVHGYYDRDDQIWRKAMSR